MTCRKVISTVAGFGLVLGLLALSAPASALPPLAESNSPSSPAATPGEDGIVDTVDDNGRATAVRPEKPRPPSASLRGKGKNVRNDKNAAAEVGLAQTREVAGYFGAEPGDLRVKEVTTDQGGSIVRIDQVIDDIPVFGGQIVTSLAADGSLLSATGETSLSTWGEFTGGDAEMGVKDAARASAIDATVRLFAEEHPDVPLDPATLSTTDPERMWFDASLMTDGVTSVSVPSYRIEVGDGGSVRYVMFIDGLGDTPLIGWSLVHELNRVVCDANSKRVANLGPAVRCGTGQAFAPTRKEGGAASSVADVNSVYNGFKATSDFYAKLGVDLTALIGSNYGDGKALRGTVRLCSSTCPYRNAFWNGEQMGFGAGFATDDIIGHELTHGVTQRVSGLAYIWESGAVSESLSDIFGEFSDLSDGIGNDSASVRWLVGEDAPGGAVRSMSDPTRYRHPDSTQSTYWQTDQYMQDAGGVHINSGVGNKTAALLADGGSLNGITVTGIGLTKSAHLWWGAARRLTSASDYQSLGSALGYTCADQAAKRINGITSADCTQVVNAVKATRMMFNPRANEAKQSPVCTTAEGKASAPLWSTSFTPAESTKYRVTNAAASGGLNWFPSSRDVYLAGLFSKDGNDSLLSIAPAQAGNGSGLITTQPFKVTRAKTYLRFTHAYRHDGMTLFGPRTAGYGIVNYSLDGGRTWGNAGGAFRWIAGPAINPNVVNTQAFTGSSYGWSISRVDLSPIVGRSVMFRWMPVSTGAGSSVFSAWWMDNAQIYTCG